MDTDFLDAEAKQIERGHEQNMPCRVAIKLMRDEVKRLVESGDLSSQEEALSALRLRVKELPQCQKRKPVKKAYSRRPKSGTKLRYK